jgi:CheY-like chemotaxis protein
VNAPNVGALNCPVSFLTDPLCRQIKLVAVTGLSGSDHRREIIAAGFDAQLDKPMTVPELEAVLRRLLG